MHVDRSQALGAFKELVESYDATQPRIALKVKHTYRVASLCERIAREIGLGAEDVDLCWLCGLLHDVGRFEQVRRFDTFSDAASVSHAALGVEMLFENGAALLRRFVVFDSCDDVIRAAIAHHSDYAIPDDLPEHTRTVASVLRDADKVDILRVNCEDTIETIYGASEADMRASDISLQVEAAFHEHRTIRSSERSTLADVLVAHVCFGFGLVFEPSMAIACEQGYLSQMLTFRFDRPDTQRRWSEMAADMRSWYAARGLDLR